MSLLTDDDDVREVYVGAAISELLELTDKELRALRLNGDEPVIKKLKVCSTKPVLTFQILASVACESKQKQPQKTINNDVQSDTEGETKVLDRSCDDEEEKGSAEPHGKEHKTAEDASNHGERMEKGKEATKMETQKDDGRKLNENGTVDGDEPDLILEILDISEKALAQERVDNILETSFDGFWDWHIKADYEYMSPGFWSHFGYEPWEKEHKPSAWMDMINQDDLKVALHNMGLHVQTKGVHPYLQEVRYRHKNGSTVWVRCKGRVVEWADDGSAVRMVGTHTDVTPLKVQLAEIQEQKEAIEKQRHKFARLLEELRALIDNANAPIFGVDQSGRINEWNQTMARILKVPYSEAKGKVLSDFAANKKIKDELEKSIDQALSGQYTTDLWVKLQNPNGDHDAVSLLVNITRRTSLEDGSVIGVLLLAQDVTELIHAREHAIRERERASAEAALNEFMAHEVRNPLAAALSACSFVREDLVVSKLVTPDSHLVEDLDVVRSSLSYIQELLTNMLDLNRHSTEAMTLCPRRTLVRSDVLEPIVAMLSYRSKDLDISLECKNEIDVVVDSLRLKQVIMNVATNATKFTPSGFVKIRALAEVSKDDVTSQMLTVFVEDSGRGIPEELQGQLFRRYCKLSTGDMRGSGLGLCLSRSIIEQMGGSIEFDPSYTSGHKGGPGCRFIIRVSLQDGKNGSDDDSTTKVNGISNVPIDHDNVYAAELHQLGDISIRNKRAISDMESGSASVNTEDTEMNGTDTKLTPDGIIGTSSSTNSSGTSIAASKKQKEPLTILEQPKTAPTLLPTHARALIVDDDLVVRMTVRRQLERLRLGWSFSEAVNGEDAIKKLTESKDPDQDPDFRYDIIVIDHFMPLTGGILNGAEAIAKLRSLDPHVVIVGMSGNDRKAEHIRNGAQMFWPKPLPPSDRLRRDLVEAFRSIPPPNKRRKICAAT